MKKIALFGLSTESALETLRLLSIHPMMALACVADDALAGKRVSEIYPGFNVVSTLAISEQNAALESDWDLAIVAEERAIANPIIRALAESGRRWIDLSTHHSKLRAKAPREPDLPEQTYGFSYRREAIVQASDALQVPSATSQALIIALAPIAEQGLLNGAIQAVSTASYEGRHQQGLSSVEVLKSNAASEALIFLAGQESDSPCEIHLATQHAPVGRALMLNCFVPLSERLTLSTLDTLYRDFYDPALFITQMTEPLDSAMVVGSNRAHFFLRAAGNQLCASVVLDRLGRGSAMQAIECANLMLGLPEEAGLLFPGHA